MATSGIKDSAHSDDRLDAALTTRQTAKNLGASARPAGSPKIDLIVADPQRVSVTRKRQSSGLEPLRSSFRAEMATRTARPAARPVDDQAFESFQISDFKSLSTRTLSKVVAGSAVKKEADGATSDLGDWLDETEEASGQINETRSLQDPLASQWVAVEQLHPIRLKDRKPYAPQTIETFALSILANGWQQPILVRPHQTVAGDYEIVVGDLPFRAARFAGLESLSVVVANLSERQALQCVLLEQVQRPDLTAFEIAKGYRQLMKFFDYGAGDLAKAVGKSEKQVMQLLRLLEMPSPVKDALERGAIELDAGPGLSDAQVDENPAARTGGRDRTSSHAGTTTARPAGANSAVTSRGRSIGIEFAALEHHLSCLLGLKVQIMARGRQGSISISFLDIDQFEWIARHLSALGAHPSGTDPTGAESTQGRPYSDLAA